MDLCGRDALAGLADGVNSALADVASATANALEEAYGNMAGLEARIAQIEKHAASITMAADNKLEVGPAAQAGQPERGVDNG